MKFNKIIILDSQTQKKGIKEINLSNLSNVIALVGKNGSGKSRILDILEEHLLTSVTANKIFDGSISFMPYLSHAIQNQTPFFKNYFLIQEKAQILAKKIQLDQSNIELQNEHTNLNQEGRVLISTGNNRSLIQTLNQELAQILPRLKQNNLRRIKSSEIRELQKSFDGTKNDQSLSFESLIEKIGTNINYNEFTSINKSALKFLATLPHKLASDKIDCLLKGGIFEEKQSYKRFLSLKYFIDLFLKKDFTWEPNSSDGNLSESGQIVTYTGSWKIDNRLFNYDEFSDGEKTLFAYALLFFLLEQNPDLNIKESILLVDEPELHLHPDSEIELIERMREVINEKGQLIFATHSINILSHLNYDEIFVVKNNGIEQKNSLTPKSSLNELMRLDDRVSKLSEFIDSIESWTYSNFMAQCFSNPEVIESAKQNDPQIEALKKAIQNNGSKECNLLLDFGAGKGRLYEQIKSDYSFIDKITYSALEPEDKFHPRLRELGAATIYETHNLLVENSFDFIVLCNVLHELKLENWIEIINKLISALKTNGFLIIIEPKKLNKGEKIGKTGYLLLSIEEMQKLFGLKTEPTSIFDQENKITCGVFTKNELKPIDKTNLIKCFEHLSENTLKKIRTLRSKKIEEEQLLTYGRESAFLSQQHINAKLALAFLEES